MSCECGVSISADKSTVRMSFRRSEIIYHIANDAFIVRQANNAGVDVSDLCADGNIDHVERIMRLTMSAIVERLYSATKSELSELPPAEDGNGYELKGECECADDCFDKVFVMTLRVSNASATTMRYIYNVVKELLICSILADWLQVVAPQLSEVWMAKAQAADSELASAINRRLGAARITPHWL